MAVEILETSASSNKSEESGNEDIPEYAQYPAVRRGIRDNAAIHDFELLQAKISDDMERIISMLSSVTPHQEQILFAWMKKTFLMVHQLCEHDSLLLQRLDRQLWDFHTLINPREPLPFSQVNVENN